MYKVKLKVATRKKEQMQVYPNSNAKECFIYT